MTTSFYKNIGVFIIHSSFYRIEYISAVGVCLFKLFPQKRGCGDTPGVLLCFLWKGGVYSIVRE